MASDRKNRFSEMLKTALIFFLTVLMLVLLLLLLLGQNENRGSSLLSGKRMMIYESGAEAPLLHGMDTGRVVPETLLFCRDASGGDYPLCFLADRSALKKSYAALYPVLREFFGGDAVCRVLDEKDGALCWEYCLCSEEFLYLSFFDELPSAVIRAYTFSGSETGDTGNVLYESADGDHAYLKELFFSAVDGVPVFVGRDADGTVSVFSRKTDAFDPAALSDAAPGHNPEVSAYIETVEGLAGGKTIRTAFLARLAPDGILCGGEFDRPALLFGDEEHRTDTALLFGGTVFGDVLSFSFFSAERLFSPEGSAVLRELLSAVGMDYADSGNYYYDKEGSRIYLNSDGALTVGTDGEVRYEALEHGGIRLSSFLGYTSVSDSYDLTEQLQASDRLVRKLTALFPALCGGGTEENDNTEVLLSGLQMQSDENAVNITYAVTYGGVPILSGGGDRGRSVEITVSNGWITAFRLFVFSAVPTGKTEILLPQTAALRAMAFASGEDGKTENSDAVRGSMIRGYVLPSEGEAPSYAGAGGKEIQPEWIFIGNVGRGDDAA